MAYAQTDPAGKGLTIDGMSVVTFSPGQPLWLLDELELEIIDARVPNSGRSERQQFDDGGMGLRP